MTCVCVCMYTEVPVSVWISLVFSLQSTLDDYEAMPIEIFGEAVLRGMGWKKGEAIGKTNKG